MAQVFHPSANTIAKASLAALLLGGLGLLYAAVLFNTSPYVTNERVALDQPVMFSHKHHVAGLGIDCRYCHTSVEHSAFAGIPATETCMTCHSQIWSQSPMLAPVRVSFANNTPLPWTRVHNLPDFAYFNHAIHVQKGVACISCHGRVDQMPLTWAEQPLHMQWCLNCHRNPGPNLRPVSAVFQMDTRTPTLPEQRELLRVNKVQTEHLTNCSTCHR